MTAGYDLIYADPPWQQQKGGLRKARPNQDRVLDYPTASLAEIEAHIKAFISGESQVLFLWTIDKFLFDAEALAQRMEFRLHARLVWNKLNGIAPAFTLRFGHEYLLWLWRGKFPAIAKEQRGKFLTVFEEPATKHSRKPTVAYSMLEALFPEARKVELYARSVRAGWDAWGNEV